MWTKELLREQLFSDLFYLLWKLHLTGKQLKAKRWVSLPQRDRAVLGLTVTPPPARDLIRLLLKPAEKYWCNIDEDNATLCFKSQLCVSGNKSQREELDSILFIFEVSHLDFIVLSRVSPLTARYAGLWTLTWVWHLQGSTALDLEKMLEFNGTAVGGISGHVKCLQTVKTKRAGSCDRGDDALKRVALRSADSRRAVTNLWSTSSKKKLHRSSWKTACQKEAASFTFNRWRCSLLAFLLENWACTQIAKCASADLCVCATRSLLVPPSVSANSPLPCFAKADPVSSTNTPFSSYLCSGPGREDGSGLATERLESCWSSDPVGCVCKASTAVNSGSTLACFLFFQDQFLPVVPTVSSHFLLIEAGLGLGSGLL